MARDGDEGMARYVLALGAAAAGIVLAIGLVLMIFTRIGARYGIGGALLAVGGALILFAWYWDRKQRRRRAGLGRV